MHHLTRLKEKILSHQQLNRWLQIWRLQNHLVVFTNGCFDILHAGHLQTLSAAKDAGDKLIVGVNSDASTTRLKGPQRPINNQSQRTLILASLLVVDAVVVFEEDTPAALIERISPDVLVKGGDYTKDQIVGADWVEQKGGQVITVPLLEGHSTTGIESRMRGTK